jgi:hypothetical protein
LLNKIANFFAPVMIVLFIALLIYGIPVFKHIYRNVDLSAQAPLSEVEWKVNEVNDEKYTLSVDYAFDVEGKHYSGSEEWQGESFKNPYAAESFAKEQKNEITQVWYEPAHPENSSVQKYFPTKRAIYFFILLFLLNYFLFAVSRYTKRQLALLRKKEEPNGKPHT